jgi:hypothetical protein
MSAMLQPLGYVPKSVVRINARTMLAVVIVFDVLVVIWWGHAGLRAHHIVGRSGDPYIYIWFLRWWGWALTHRKNLVVTHLVGNPVGNNILWDTGVPSLFLPFSLLHTYVHVPVDALFDVLWTGSWAGTGIVAYWTFVRLTHHVWGSTLGHLLVLFSGYENAESLAHLDLMWLGFVFLFLMVGIEWVTDQRSTPSFVAWGTALSVLQWLTNEELFAMMWTTALLGLAVRPRNTQLAPTRRAPVWPPVILLVAMVAILILPLAWIQTHSPAQPTSSLHFAGFFGVDLENLILIPVHTVWHLAPGRHWFGNVYEDVGYVGIWFFVLFTGYWVVEQRFWSPPERLAARWLILWWLVLAIMALGPYLRWDGHVIMVLPGLLLNFVPVLQDMVLPRFMGIAIWIVGFGSALAVTYTDNRQSRLTTFILSAGIILLATSWLPAPHPALSTHTGHRKAIPELLHRLHAPPHPTVLVFPFDNVANPTNLMLLQSQDHFAYRLAEGYLSPIDPILTKFPHLVSAWDHLDAPGSLRNTAASPFPALVWKSSVHHYLQIAHPFAIILLRHTSTFPRNLMWWTTVLGPASGKTAQAVYWVRPLTHSHGNNGAH